MNTGLRRFPAPWTVEAIDAGFKVIDGNGQAVAYVYDHADKRDAGVANALTLDEARRIASNIAKLPKLLGKGGAETVRGFFQRYLNKRRSSARILDAKFLIMRGLRLNGWQRTGVVLSILWVSCASMWFIQQVPAHQPAITSVYRQCIEEPNAHRSACKARAESFGKEVRSELAALLDRAEWPLIALAPVFLVWILAYIVVWCAGLVAALAASINAATQADTRNMPRVGLSTSRRR